MPCVPAKGGGEDAELVGGAGDAGGRGVDKDEVIRGRFPRGGHGDREWEEEGDGAGRLHGESARGGFSKMGR